MTYQSLSKWCLLFAVGAVLGCCGEEKVTTLKDMYNDERALPAVFLQAETQTQVVAPGDQPVFVKEGHLYWRALTCDNPNCPETSNAAEPFLFIAPDPAIIANPDGTVGYDRSLVDEADNNFGNCPACLKIRNLNSESDKDRQQYSNSARPYVLPETLQRREELADARKKREEQLRKRMSGG